MKVNKRKKSSHIVSVINAKSVHPWRQCGYGKHWVVEHKLHIPPSAKNPNGSIVTRMGHCHGNPSKKDHFYPDEIREISAQHFSKLKTKPCNSDLGIKGTGNKYDVLIAGWVQYWNEVLNPNEPLDVNLVKALIASESSFDAKVLANKKNKNSARGLTQITNETRKILSDPDGEIKDHFVTATLEDLNDPTVNICAGVRWLFHKKYLFEKRAKKQVSWPEAIYDYKGASKVPPARAAEIMRRYLEFLEKLKKCKQ